MLRNVAILCLLSFLFATEITANTKTFGQTITYQEWNQVIGALKTQKLTIHPEAITTNTGTFKNVTATGITANVEYIQTINAKVYLQNGSPLVVSSSGGIVSGSSAVLGTVTVDSLIVNNGSNLGDAQADTLVVGNGTPAYWMDSTGIYTTGAVSSNTVVTVVLTANIITANQIHGTFYGSGAGITGIPVSVNYSPTISFGFMYIPNSAYTVPTVNGVDFDTCNVGWVTKVTVNIVATPGIASFIVSYPGWYSHFVKLVGSMSSTDEMRFALFQNGVELPEAQGYQKMATSGYRFSTGIDCLIYCNAGDVITLKGFDSTTTTDQKKNIALRSCQWMTLRILQP